MAMVKVIRRVTIPDVTVTIGSVFNVYQLRNTGRWVIYMNAERIGRQDGYDTRREAQAIKRELDDRRMCCIHAHFAPHAGNEVEA